MDVFEIRDSVFADYSDFVRSFIRIQDEQVKATVDDSLNRGDLWHEALIQLISQSYFSSF